MIQTLSKNWLLLALCGVLEAAISVIYLIMQRTDGPVTFHAWNATIVFLGELAMAAGACTVAAGILRSTTRKCWPLVLNGLALAALGLIQFGFTRFRISFLTVGLLIILMAMSLGVLEFATARTPRSQRHFAGGWFPKMAGVGSVGFALVFLALGFRWIKIGPSSHADLLWLGLYLGFSAICMLELALRAHGQGASQSGPSEPLPQFPNPRHAH